MINVKTYARFAADPSAFRNSLNVDCDGTVRKLGDIIDPWQRDDFALLDPALKRCAGRSDKPARMRMWCERARGHSKTTDLACTAIWALAFATRPIRGYCYAADRDQAALLKDAMSTLIRLNPWLADILVVQKNGVVNIADGHPGENGTLTIEASDVASSWGILPDLIVADEVCHWQGDGSLWESLISSAAKRSGCLLCVISNAGFAESWQWNVRESARTDADNWIFSRLDGSVASWISPASLAEQRRMLPETAYNRLWLNIWSSGLGDCLTPEQVASAFRDELQPMTGSEKNFYFVAGVDLGLTRDCSAVVVLAVPRGGTAGRLRLAANKLWRPTLGTKIDLMEVERYLLDLDARYHLEYVGFDPWQHELLAQRIEADLNRRRRNSLRRHWRQPFMRSMPPTGANLREQATLLIETFQDARFLAYPCEPLRRDLLQLRIEEKSYGFRLISPRTGEGHGDTCSAYCLALVLAHELGGKAPIRIGARLFHDTDEDAFARLDRAQREYADLAIRETDQEGFVRGMTSAFGSGYLKRLR